MTTGEIVHTRMPPHPPSMLLSIDSRLHVRMDEIEENHGPAQDPQGAHAPHRVHEGQAMVGPWALGLRGGDGGVGAFLCCVKSGGWWRVISRQQEGVQLCGEPCPRKKH